MTTTGDLFVNIKGNNSGLRKSLNQSSRDIKSFSRDVERQAKGGLGMGDMLGLAALLKGKSIMQAMTKMGNAEVKGGTPRANRRWFAASAGLMDGPLGKNYGKAVSKERRKSTAMGNMLDAELRAERRVLLARGIDPSNSINHTRKAGHRDRFRAEERRMIGLQKWQNRGASVRKFLLSATGAITSVAGAVAGGLLIANANKWQKRVNEATGMYSSAVIRNRAQLEKKNLLKDISMARDPALQKSSIMRQNAADYRRNSGKNWAQISNVAGSAMDYTIGYLGNVLTGSYMPDIVGMTTEQRLAKVQGGAI